MTKTYDAKKLQEVGNQLKKEVKAFDEAVIAFCTTMDALFNEGNEAAKDTGSKLSEASEMPGGTLAVFMAVVGAAVYSLRKSIAFGIGRGDRNFQALGTMFEIWLSINGDELEKKGITDNASLIRYLSAGGGNGGDINLASHVQTMMLQ